jgi:hypothetical protein
MQVQPVAYSCQHGAGAGGLHCAGSCQQRTCCAADSVMLLVNTSCSSYLSTQAEAAGDRCHRGCNSYGGTNDARGISQNENMVDNKMSEYNSANWWTHMWCCAA